MTKLERAGFLMFIESVRKEATEAEQEWPVVGAQNQEQEQQATFVKGKIAGKRSVADALEALLELSK